jgi:ABC-2 type transport system ATP-binding protein
MADESSSKAVEITHLTRAYGKILAVNDISFSINPGIIFGLLGPNGAGKTTIIKMLTTLLPPTSGEIIIAGHDSAKDSRKIRSKIGYVPQLLSADGTLTGYENSMLSAKLYNLPTKLAKERIQQMLQLMELTSVSNMLVRTYSGGMIRKLEIGQALLHRPSILFLDEPTIGLDPISRETVWKRLKQLTRSLKLAILITTHDMQEADAICDELAILYQGKIIVQGTKEELKDSVGKGATLNDVFNYYCKGSIDEGTYQHAIRTRKTINRMD